MKYRESLHRVFGRRDAERVGAGIRVASVVPTLAQDEIPEHTHLEPHFILINRGRYCSAVAADIAEPTLIFNPLGTTHRDCFHRAQVLTDAHFYSITVSVPAWQALADPLRLPSNARTLPSHWMRSTQRHLAQIFTREHIPLDLEGLVADLVSPLDDQWGELLHRGPKWIARAVAALRDGGTDNLNLAALAKSCDIHPVYFSRAFRRHTGVSPGAYARRVRLERALALLLDPTQTVSRVAQACGFFDHAHMTHAFWSAFRVSPSAFRRLHGLKVHRVQDEQHPAA